MEFMLYCCITKYIFCKFVICDYEYNENKEFFVLIITKCCDYLWGKILFFTYLGTSKIQN